ncbi:MAG: TetR/AcrR family transcriptional regulator [Candidatus Aminicenantales bacterium]
MRQIAQREDIRDLILDGVDVLLARHGFKKMTMEDLARQVGIGKGTIYLHFRGKEELTLSHIDRIAERLLARLEELARSADPPDERLRKMLAERVLYRFDSVTHYSQSLNDLLSSVRKSLLARREVHFDKEAAVLERVLRDGVRRGVLACPDPASAAHVLVWSTNSLLPFSLTTRELGKRKEMEERVSRIADALLKGLVRT